MAHEVFVVIHDLHDGVNQGLTEEVRFESEVDEFLVFGVVVVCFLLDSRVLEVFDVGGDAVGCRCMFDEFGELEHVELLGELVKDAELATISGIKQGQFDACKGITNIEKAARLATLTVDGHGHIANGLDDKSVERRAEDGIVIEAR